MQKFAALIFSGAIVALGILWTTQRQSLRDSRDRLAALEAEVAGLPAATTHAPSSEGLAAGRARTGHSDLGQRLGELERTVAQLARAIDSLMERGQVALTTNKLDELQHRVLDPSLPEKERLQALRLLRRNKGLSDEVVLGALAWLQSSTNGNVRQDILQQLDGVTNAALRQPLLALAKSDADPKVRAQAVENLRRLAGDGDVERSLWEIAQQDSDPKVREKAQEALREGQMTAERAARLQQRVGDAQASVEERLLAMRALVRSGTDISGATAALTQLAQNTGDPATRAEVFRAFDGGHDPGMLSPLVGGLQDADPGVRKAAADALSGFVSDPRVRQWLEYVAKSDGDTKVRREAAQVLKRFQNQR